jgi:3-methyladenine DNA glycosylase AlkD
MTRDQTMQVLEASGTEQNRKVYARHGVTGDQFGVSFAELGKLARQIKVNHALAQQLWKTGNADARMLATKIADPAQVTEKELNAWVKDIRYYALADSFAGLVYATKHARARMEAWMSSRDEYPAAVAWNLVAQFAGGDGLDDGFYAACVEKVEKGVAGARNRTRYAMNMALINIGLRNPALEKMVLATARRIGPIEVDHGETGCKTPDVAAYIAKTKAYRAGKAGSKKS